ncbi:alpha/beta fold hydrolase [Dyadobacter beijingensis]|nr:alpha/beta hydrolase [Dyadobacter beijingensis]
MNRSLCCLLLSLTILSCTDAKKQEGVVKEIHYGSNNGKYVSIYGTRIYYETYGTGVPLLVLHQGLGSIENLAGVIPGLAKHFRVIAPDSPGHGRSEHADSLSGELMADYCSVLIDSLHLDSAYVFGWSTGGNTALLLAAKRPDKVKKVVSGASNTRASGLTPEARDLLKAYTIEAVKEDGDWLKHYQSMNPNPEKWVRFWEENQKMWAREVKVPDDKLSKINVPVLIIRGDRDMIRLEHSIEMYRALKQGQLCIYPNTGHEMPDEKGDVLSRIAVDFFTGK